MAVDNMCGNKLSDIARNFFIYTVCCVDPLPPKREKLIHGAREKHHYFTRNAVF